MTPESTHPSVVIRRFSLSVVRGVCHFFDATAANKHCTIITGRASVRCPRGHRPWSRDVISLYWLERLQWNLPCEWRSEVKEQGYSETRCTSVAEAHSWRCDVEDYRPRALSTQRRARSRPLYVVSTTSDTMRYGIYSWTERLGKSIVKRLNEQRKWTKFK